MLEVCEPFKYIIIIREVNVRVLEWAGVAECEWWQFEINQLLFANDTALVTDLEKLCRLVSEFGGVCERRKLRVNVGTSKIMRCSKYGMGVECM